MQLPDSRIACTNIIHLKTSTAVEQEVHIFYLAPKPEEVIWSRRLGTGKGPIPRQIAINLDFALIAR